MRTKCFVVFPFFCCFILFVIAVDRQINAIELQQKSSAFVVAADDLSRWHFRMYFKG